MSTAGLTASHLCVSAHDLARFLVESLAVPAGVQALQLASQTIVLAQKQRVKGCQGNVFVHAHVTWREAASTLQPIPKGARPPDSEFDPRGGLTCNETGHLPGVGVVGDPFSGGAHVHLEGVEGQQLPAVVPELGVDAQQAAVVGEVAEVERQLLLGAVHLAEVQEGGQGVDLLPPVGLPAKVVCRESGSTDGGRPERRDAVVRAVGEAGVARGDLSESGTRRLRAEIFERTQPAPVWVRAAAFTGMGMQGSVCSQLSSQFTPLLKERMLGENGVKVRSWSFHCPNKVTM